jgi:methionyl-tRNA formyltransferase
MSCKVAFFGSSKYSVQYLERLISIGYELKLIVSQPDKPVGRGLEVIPTPVKMWARDNNILVLTPSNLSDPLFLGALTTLPLDIGLSSYYGLLIPAQVINHFKHGILNVHHSLLPKHRGANPIPWTILAGEKVTGTTIIRIGEKFDDGQIAAQAELNILETDNNQTLREKLDAKALELLSDVLPEYLDGKLTLKKQNLKDGGYDQRVTKELAKINWKQTDEEIERSIRAFTPWPGAWSTVVEVLEKFKYQTSNIKMKDKSLKILKAKLGEDKHLIIEDVQIEGKTPTDWKQFLAGYAGN